MILPTVGGPFDFLVWYALYPRKVGRAAAEKAWGKLTLPERKQACDCMPAHLRYWRFKGTEWEFLPHPSTWITAKRFLDELPVYGGSARVIAHNGGTASPSMAAYGQTAAGSSTSHGAVAQPGSHAHRPSPVAGVATPPTAPPPFLVDSNVRLGQARTLADALAPFHALVKKHRS